MTDLGGMPSDWPVMNGHTSNDSPISYLYKLSHSINYGMQYLSLLMTAAAYKNLCILRQ